MFDAVTTWYRHNRRDLPMRSDHVSPWATLVFEVMSQQTPIPRVQPIWERWMERWPTPVDLARARRSDVLVAWDHLGYPSRALRLHTCAQAIANRPGSRVPADMDALLELPGIGPYTASAVASFSFHQRVPVLDTNIRRVLTRVFDGRQFARKSAPSRAEQNRAWSLLPDEGDACALWNVAIMELGALVCTQRAPLCDQCPISKRCRWLADGQPADAVKPRGQAWAGTDRQARGRVMALLRDAHASSAERVGRDAVIQAATLPGAPADQAVQVVDSLVNDGLIEVDRRGTYGLPD